MRRPSDIYSQIGLCLAAALMLMVVGCKTSDQKSAFANIATDGWLYGDTVVLVLDQDTDTMLRGDLCIAVRHTNEYEYSNLWLELRYDGPDSVLTDTFNISLADTFGKWHGKGVGVSFQTTDTLLRNVAVNPANSMRVRHIMRCDTLSDVEQIGLIFIPKL